MGWVTPAICGSGGRTIGWKAQWVEVLRASGKSAAGSVATSSGHGAPAATQLARIARSSAGRGSASAGIRASASSVVTRRTISLASGFPATIPGSPESPPANARSRSSIRQPLSTVTGPWQAPQRRARSGATTVAKSGASAAGGSARTSPVPNSPASNSQRGARRAAKRKKRLTTSTPPRRPARSGRSPLSLPSGSGTCQPRRCSRTSRSRAS